MRRQAERRGEAADQVGRVGVQDTRRRAQREPSTRRASSRSRRSAASRCGRGRRGRCRRGAARSRSPISASRLSASSVLLQAVAGCSWCDCGPAAARRRRLGVATAAPIRRSSSDVGVEVEHALAEAVRGGRPAGVRDVRRQQRDRGAQRAVLVAVEVVADRALVDDQQRPGVVRVHRVGVVGEPGVEDLDDARHRRAPRPRTRSVRHARRRTYKTAAAPGATARSTPCASTPRSPSCCATTWRPGSG